MADAAQTAKEEKEIEVAHLYPSKAHCREEKLLVREGRHPGDKGWKQPGYQATGMGAVAGK